MSTTPDSRDRWAMLRSLVLPARKPARHTNDSKISLNLDLLDLWIKGLLLLQKIQLFHVGLSKTKIR